MGRQKKRGSPQHVISWGEVERPNSSNLNVRLSHRWLGKKNFRNRRRRRISPGTDRSEGARRDREKKDLRRIFPEPYMAREKYRSFFPRIGKKDKMFFPSHVWLGENARLPSGPPKIHGIFGGQGPLRFQRNQRRRSSAVENRLRFSTAEVGSPENS